MASPAMPGTRATPTWGRSGQQGSEPHRTQGIQPCWGRRRDWAPPIHPQSLTPEGTARDPGLTFVERRVQEGVIEEQAPALSPALGLAPHHQFTVAGCLQTFRHKERGQGGSGRAEFPVVGQQGANSELCVSPTLLLRGCSPAGSDLNPPGWSSSDPSHSLSAPSCPFTVPSKLRTAGTAFISGTPSQSPEPMAPRCAQGARLLGYFPTSGPKADPSCFFLQACSDDPAPGKAMGAGIVLGLENGLNCVSATSSPWTCPIPRSPPKVLPQGDPQGCKDRNPGGSQSPHREAAL